MINRMKVEDRSEQTIKSYVWAVDRLVRFHDLILHKQFKAGHLTLPKSMSTLDYTELKRLMKTKGFIVYDSRVTQFANF